MTDEADARAVELLVADAGTGEAQALVAEMAAYLDALYPEDGEEDPAPWSLEGMLGAGTFLLARVDGAAAACGGITPLPEPGAMEIVRMYVRPGFRGLGLADRVLAALEELARMHGSQALRLRCGPRQPAALRVYARNGYVRRAAFAHHREHPTNIFLEKRLAAAENANGLELLGSASVRSPT